MLRWLRAEATRTKGQVMNFSKALLRITVLTLSYVEPRGVSSRSVPRVQSRLPLSSRHNIDQWWVSSRVSGRTTRVPQRGYAIAAIGL